MDSIRIYAQDISEVSEIDNTDKVRIRRKFDHFIYFCDRDYFNRSMADRGFVVIRFSD